MSLEYLSCRGKLFIVGNFQFSRGNDFSGVKVPMLVVLTPFFVVVLNHTLFFVGVGDEGGEGGGNFKL